MGDQPAAICFQRPWVPPLHEAEGAQVACGAESAGRNRRAALSKLPRLAVACGAEHVQSVVCFQRRDPRGCAVVAARGIRPPLPTPVDVFPDTLRSGLLFLARQSKGAALRPISDPSSLLVATQEATRTSRTASGTAASA
jgi:hypothetical protein